MNHKVYTAIIIAAFGLGTYLGKSYFSQTKLETREVEVERIKNNIVTVTREVVKPDGSKTIDTIVTDKSVEKKDSTTTKTVVTASRPDWHISASASTDFKGLAPVYGVQVERNVFGPFSLGVRLDTQRTVGIVIGMEF